MSTPFAAVAAVSGALAGHGISGDLGDLSLEELAAITVASVSKREEMLFDTPAAAYVVTAADIQRSGVRTLPEALRLAPGVEVARTGQDSWSITMRGLNSDLSNKLLVLIDGRSVYSPLYAGVFWDVQHVMLDDVDRIEVIGGPGGTMWGANAVNGVINIITKRADATAGGLLAVSGDDPAISALRYGAPVAGGDARAYVRHYGFDGREHAQGGFRWDRGADDERVTVQGDVYRGTTDGVFRGPFTLGTLPAMLPGRIEMRGHNLIGRWTREDTDGDSLRLRAYLDHTFRDHPGTFRETRDTVDLELQLTLAPRGRHQWSWGFGARTSADEVVSTSFAAFDPAERTAVTAHAFVQDVVSLSDTFRVTLGSKLEHNDFTGFELQPQARAAWRLGRDAVAWAAMSRAVRVPSRLDHDLTLTAPISLPTLPLPLFVIVEGSEGFGAENLVAHELGYRMRVGTRWSFDATLFRHEYEGLQVTSAGPPVPVGGEYLLIEADLVNGMDGDGTGAVLAANFSPGPAVRFQYHFSYLDLDLVNRAGISSNGPSVAGNSPRHSHALRAFWDVRDDVSLYLAWRRVGALPGVTTPAYDASDVSVRWSPTSRVDLQLAATDLGGDHTEFQSYRVESAVSGRLVWHF